LAVAKADICPATYLDQFAALDDYQVVQDLHVSGLVGGCDAAVITKGATGKAHENEDETSTRHGAWSGVAAGAAVRLIFATDPGRGRAGSSAA
jgi:uncharacterized membrane protein